MKWLKRAREWRPNVDKESLTKEILIKLQSEFLGVEFNFSQCLSGEKLNPMNHL